MRHVMIDGERPVEITPVIHDHPSEGRTVVLAFTEAHAILEAWKELSPARRDFMYGNHADDNEPAKIIIAEAERNGIGRPVLLFETVEPYWDGVSTLNQYPLEELASAMSDALEWGEAIGEAEL